MIIPANECVIFTAKRFSSYYNGVELWSPGGNCNRRLPDLPNRQHYYGASTIYFDKMALVCGGRDKNHHSCLKLDPETETWSHHSNLVSAGSVANEYMSHVKVGKKLFLVGGYRSDIQLQYLEAGSTIWQTGPAPPNNFNYRYSCAVQDSEESFMLFTQGSVRFFRFNVSQNSWETLPVDLNIYSNIVSCGRVDEKIILASQDSSSNLHTFLYNIANRTWSEVGEPLLRSLQNPILGISQRYFKIENQGSIAEEFLPHSRSWIINTKPLLPSNGVGIITGAVVPKNLFKDCL